MNTSTLDTAGNRKRKLDTVQDTDTWDTVGDKIKVTQRAVGVLKDPLPSEALAEESSKVAETVTEENISVTVKERVQVTEEQHSTAKGSFNNESKSLFFQSSNQICIFQRYIIF